ncbi:hypothetical protein SARC_11959 [Sphaeroforma arctica JP610]|uniref:C2H2-type domain-containing protein n=1 Tax=Sphaeroforma arctica JP610 TaxID=667725 RepID=A0A0L0FGD1_9EUKA|nr:hypothetical protein SARC_11959 [Sphaeroforma arctica JP610]KNC75516.1 hypothetical protein SARC_11959 [Sphaeroforma arctica JP610]|eukprot:XP_014149418.1 hypothetical protein SARC_11959 [Sphaeroforma arctica JP610]
MKSDRKIDILDDPTGSPDNGSDKPKATSTKRIRRSYQQLDRTFACEDCNRKYASEHSMNQHIRLKHVSPTPPLAMLGKNPFLLPKSGQSSVGVKENALGDDQKQSESIRDQMSPSSTSSARGLQPHHHTGGITKSEPCPRAFESRSRYENYHVDHVRRRAAASHYPHMREDFADHRNYMWNEAGHSRDAYSEPIDNPLWTRIIHSINRQQDLHRDGFLHEEEYHEREPHYHSDYNSRYYGPRWRPHERAYSYQYAHHEPYTRSSKPIRLTNNGGNRMATPESQYPGGSDLCRRTDVYPNGSQRRQTSAVGNIHFSQQTRPVGSYLYGDARPGGFHVGGSERYRHTGPSSQVITNRRTDNPTIPRPMKDASFNRCVRTKSIPTVVLQDRKPNARKISTRVSVGSDTDTAECAASCSNSSSPTSDCRSQVLANTLSTVNIRTPDIILTDQKSCELGVNRIEHASSSHICEDNAAGQNTIIRTYVKNMNLSRCLSANTEVFEDSSVEALMSEITQLSSDETKDWGVDQIDYTAFSIADLDLLEPFCTTSTDHAAGAIQV